MPDELLPIPEYPVVEVEIVGPTDEQVAAGLAEIERLAPGWLTTPAYLMIKPEYGLIVSVKKIEHDREQFTLTLAVEEVIVAPEGFDPTAPFQVSSGWDQPYLSMKPHIISAPYSYRLEFGAHGVQNIRSCAGTGYMEYVKSRPSPWLLSSCFRPDFKLPDDAKPVRTA